MMRSSMIQIDHSHVKEWKIHNGLVFGIYVQWEISDLQSITQGTAWTVVSQSEWAFFNLVFLFTKEVLQKCIWRRHIHSACLGLFFKYFHLSLPTMETDLLMYFN